MATWHALLGSWHSRSHNAHTRTQAQADVHDSPPSSIVFLLHLRHPIFPFSSAQAVSVSFMLLTDGRPPERGDMHQTVSVTPNRIQKKRESDQLAGMT